MRLINKLSSFAKASEDTPPRGAAHSEAFRSLRVFAEAKEGEGVDLSGIEPLASSLRTRRSTS